MAKKKTKKKTEKLTVKDNPQLFRDSETQAIISHDNSAYAARKKAIAISKDNANKDITIRRLEGDVDLLKIQMLDLMNMINNGVK